MKIGILLSGCGVYDGAEIQEAIFSLLAVQENEAEAIFIGIDKDQHHVVNHINGEEMKESRNMLVEAARIARGDIKNINDVQASDIDALIIPGGFGSAKNFTSWAFEGPESTILPEVKLFLVNLFNIGKPIAALCVSPVVLAKALEDSQRSFDLTIGSDRAESPYDINGFAQGLQKCGANTSMKTSSEILIDEKNNLITAPCYMMNVSALEVRNNIKMAVDALVELVKKSDLAAH